MSCNCCPQKPLIPSCTHPSSAPTIVSKDPSTNTFNYNTIFNSEWIVNLSLPGFLNGSYTLSNPFPIVNPTTRYGYIYGQNTIDAISFPPLCPGFQPCGSPSNALGGNASLIIGSVTASDMTPLCYNCTSRSFDLCGIFTKFNLINITSDFSLYQCLVFLSNSPDSFGFSSNVPSASLLPNLNCYDLFLGFVINVYYIKHGLGGLGTYHQHEYRMFAMYRAYLPIIQPTTGASQIIATMPDEFVMYNAIQPQIVKTERVLYATDTTETVTRLYQDFYALPDTITINRV